VRPRPSLSCFRHRLAGPAFAGVAMAVVVLVGGTMAVAPGSASASPDRPSGYYFGSDSNGPRADGSYPYSEPGIGGHYASYGGEIGTWTNWRHCTTGEALNMTDVDAVNADESADPSIPGLSFYWFMAGPGADPDYDATTSEAYDWGRAQAERVESDYLHMESEGIRTETHYVPMMYMDIEGGAEAEHANGWNEIVDYCGRILSSTVIPVAVDRATFNGFYNYIHLDTIFHPGVYSSPYFWDQTFGTGSASRIPDTYEWTPESSTSATTPAPVGFTQGSRSAQWFGGISPEREAGWQWTENGGDWDQMNSAHLP
jgi:hypothetical protein